MRVPSVLAAGVLGLASAGAEETVRGRIVDGTAMARGLDADGLRGHGHGGQLLENAARVPLGKRSFTLHVIAEPARGRSWAGTTDEEGRFALSLGGAKLPAGRSLVVAVEGSPPLHSAALEPSRDEIEFRVYSSTESARFVRSKLDVYHLLADNPPAERMDLEVRIELSMVNGSGELFVGPPPRSPKGSREILRVPVPREAAVLLSRGPRGERWTEVPGERGWKWMVLDWPVLPFLEDPGGAAYELRYRIPARQDWVATYPVPFDISLFAVWGVEAELSVEASFQDLPGSEKVEQALDEGGPVKEWTVRFAKDPRAGRSIRFGVHVDNVKLGQVNRGSLLVVLAYLTVAVGAIGAGLIFGRKGPSLESLLDAATGEELVARIAALDQRFEEGRIPERDYQETRAKLVAMARYLVPELGGGEPGGAKGGGAAGGSSTGKPGAPAP